MLGKGVIRLVAAVMLAAMLPQIALAEESSEEDEAAGAAASLLWSMTTFENYEELFQIPLD